MSTDLRPGAHLIAPAVVRFVVWAPHARSVVLQLHGPVHRELGMQPLDGGYFQAIVQGVGAGQRYLYRLDNHQPRPDPASRCQPDGVHGPSAVVDPHFDWPDVAFKAPALEEMILYELHVGTFSESGTFEGVASQLDRLKELGVNALEIMPVAQFPGRRNWGYDGVYPFCVQSTYGGPQGLKRLVVEAHRRGIAVLLDVVYNHLGPEGNYFRQFGPYFTDQYRTPWGDPLNFDGPGCDGVRDFVLENVRMWQEEFRLDGLRLDAVPWIKDFSARHILAQIAEECEMRSQHLGRSFTLIGESDANDPRVIRPRERGGYGLHAQWSDDFHHALHAYLTGERCGYYADHGSLDNIARALRDAYVLTGQYSHYRRRRYGAPATDRESRQFVIFTQNHDQVGNRPRGDRLSNLVDFETLKLAAALLLTAPYVPMLWMGEEYGETNAFPFFIHHSDGGLIERVRQGRRREFAHLGLSGEPFDPADEQSFRRARLDVSKANHGQGQALYAWHRELIALRKHIPALATLCRRQMRVEVCEQSQVLTIRRHQGGDAVVLLFHFGQQPTDFSLQCESGRWRRFLDSTEPRWGGPGSASPHEFLDVVTLRLERRSIVGYRRT